MDTKPVTRTLPRTAGSPSWPRAISDAWERWRVAHHRDAIRAAHGLAAARPFHVGAWRSRVSHLRRELEAAIGIYADVDESQPLRCAVLTTTAQGHALTVDDFEQALAAVEARVIAWRTRGTRPPMRRGQRPEDLQLWQTLRRIRREHGITGPMVAESLWPKAVARKTDRQLTDGERARRDDLTYLCPALRTSRGRLRDRLERKLARRVEETHAR